VVYDADGDGAYDAATSVVSDTKAWRTITS
jgi:hypothetical protein